MPILSEIFDHMPVASYHIDFSNKITHINHHALKLFKLKPQDCVGRTPQHIFSPDFAAEYFEAINLALIKKQTGTYNFLHKTGQQSFRFTATPVNTGVIATFMTIQENQAQKQASVLLENDNTRLEQEVSDRNFELHKNHALLQTIFDTTLIGMSIFEPVRNADDEILDFRILIVNKKIERSSGRKDMVGKLYGDLYPGIKKMGLYNAMVKTMETGEPVQMEYHYIYEGVDRWYSTMFVKGENTLVSTNLDITDRVNAEIQMREMESRQQQEIFQVTLNTQEEERRRISESLHNGLGQLLYGIKLSLNYLTLKLATMNPVKYATSRDYIDQLLADAIKETRLISHELMPTVLAEFGIEAAIREVCEQLHDNIKFHCTLELDHFEFDNYMELAIFRTVQELMVNVVKHSQASLAYVSVTVENSEIKIRVEDNGVGMPIPPAKQGIGLSSIRNKVDMLKGNFILNSPAEKGLVVEVSLPAGPFKTK